MKPQQSFAVAIVALITVLLFSSLYVVKQGQEAIVVRLGEVIASGDTGQAKVDEPGLHVKIPLIDQPKWFDVRVLGLTSRPFNVLTAQQTFLTVNYFVKWHITNLPLFYKSTNRGDVSRAEELLEQNINDIVRAQFGTHSSNQAISSERDKIMMNIRNEANALDKIKEMGVKVIDVRLKSVVLPDRVLKSVFARMASERKQFAENARAEGNRVAEGIRALADQQVVIIKAEAGANGAQIRAEGDKEAADIYANTYSKDAEFYSFYRSLEAYKASFGHRGDMLVLRPESQFFHYFNSDAQSVRSRK